MIDPILYISEEIRKVLCPGSSTQDPPRIIKIIRNTISFTLKRNVWRNLFKTEPDNLLERLFTMEGQEQFVEQLKHLAFPIESCLLICSNFFTISFHKQQIIKFLFHEILESKTFGKNITVSANPVEVSPIADYDLENISNYRIKLVYDSLRNILQLLSFPSNDNNKRILSVTGASSSTSGSLKCGLVIDEKTKKVCELKTSQYIHQRSTAMKLIAVHRNGLRACEGFGEFIKKLGLAAVSIDLLEVKHTSPVQIMGQGCTKGVSLFYTILQEWRHC